MVEFGELICLFPPNACRGERCGVLGAQSLQSNVVGSFSWSVSSSSSAEGSPRAICYPQAHTKDRHLHHDLFGSGRGTSTLNLQIEFLVALSGGVEGAPFQRVFFGGRERFSARERVLLEERFS